MPSQQQRSDATRERLLAGFRTALLDGGLEAATTAVVLAQAGLSKGALYHHFAGKADIVEAIYRAESHGAIHRAVARVDARLAPIDQLKRSCAAWLDEIAKPDVARILFHIGPAALGSRRVMAIENELSLVLFEALINEAAAAGDIAIARPALAAQLINAMVAEVAMKRPADRLIAARVIDPVVDAILAGLSDDGRDRPKGGE